jgi:hypothetical protein
MAEFLTTHGTAFQIERIITGARERLCLISPYLRLSKTLLERLQDANRRGVKTQLIYGKSSLNPEEEAALLRLDRLGISFFENLHAKCYCNEQYLVITSMNLHEFSEKTNREMGVLFSSDEQAYHDAMGEIQSILAAAATHHNIGIVRDKRSARAEYSRVVRGRSRSYAASTGVCIRCTTRIPQNPDAPYCNSCYSVWAAYGNPDYLEQVCHLCGRQAETSMARPLCWACYRSHGA